MEIVRSVNRSWGYDSYFGLYRPIHPGGNVRREMSGELSEYRFYELFVYTRAALITHGDAQCNGVSRKISGKDYPAPHIA